MRTIPIATKDHAHDQLIIILSRDDWERMRQADPVQLDWTDMVVQTQFIYQPLITICYEPDITKVMVFLNKGDIIGALRFLQRGVSSDQRTTIQKAIDTLGRSGDY